MSLQEGVIKFSLSHRQAPIKNHISILDINAWRTLFFKLQLIGQIKERYAGYGFGNISQRLNVAGAQTDPFIISGTQTGGLESLSKHHYCTVLEANPEKNTIISEGEIKPSSEALTHANIYHQNTTIDSVIHIHSPEIWNNTVELNLPYTAENIAYGTPKMANAVTLLFNTAQFQNFGLFSMLGHEDGIFAFADSMEKAGSLLIQLYIKAIALEQYKRHNYNIH